MKIHPEVKMLQSPSTMFTWLLQKGLPRAPCPQRKLNPQRKAGGHHHLERSWLIASEMTRGLGT